MKINMVDKVETILENTSKAKILCIGDIMLDNFIYGEVARISPEAPIPVMRIRKNKEMLGGVGNVIANINTIGGKAVIASVIGNDEAGQKIKQKLTNIYVPVHALLTDYSRPTSLKTRFISSGQQLLRADMEEISPISANIRTELLNKINLAQDGFDVIVISDYGKGVVSSELIEELISMGKKVIIDPKGRDYSIYKNAYLITPNKKELEEATGMPAGSDEAVVKAAKYLINKFSIQNVLATRSKDGMTVVSKDGNIQHIKTKVKEVFDVSGAGDTVVANVATMIASGADLVTAAEIANIAASIVVGKVGTATVSIDEIKAKIANDTAGEIMENMATSRVQAKEQVERWRQKGLKIGFTNGCFDLIHPGHISLLQQAKDRCDKLVVGLNTDASIKRLKGETRPVQDEISRAMVLKAMNAVDMVVLFDEDTPEKLLEELQPDLLVKGGDYTISEVVGAEYVMSYGGEVFLAELEEGQSTTNMIKRSAS